jgi:hypothetical protein
MSAPLEMGLRAFARHIHKKPSYISELKGEGRLVLSDCGKLIKVAESIQRIADTMDPSKFAVSARHAANRAAALPVAALPAPDAAQSDSEPPAADLGSNPRYQESKAMREEYLAKSARRDYEQSMGKLLPADDVLAVVSSAMSGLRSRFEQLPDILGPQLAALTDEAQVRSLMADTIEHALEDAARQFAQISKNSEKESRA